MTSLSHRSAETPQQSLARIEGGFSQNDVLVVQAFAERGVNPDDITPRDNVLTFNSWKAKVRRVAKGATSVRVIVWIPVKDKGGEDGKQAMRPKTACLFHVSQTVASDAPKGTRPDAWANPHLVKDGTYEPVSTAVDEPTDVTINTPDGITAMPADEFKCEADLALPDGKVAKVYTHKPKREALPDIGKPESGKQYSLSGIATGKTWAESEVTP